MMYNAGARWYSFSMGYDGKMEPEADYTVEDLERFDRGGGAIGRWAHQELQKRAADCPLSAVAKLRLGATPGSLTLDEQIEITKYSDDEVRDDHGRWTSEGGTGDHGTLSAGASRGERDFADAKVNVQAGLNNIRSDADSSRGRVSDSYMEGMQQVHDMISDKLGSAKTVDDLRAIKSSVDEHIDAHADDAPDDTGAGMREAFAAYRG